MSIFQIITSLRDRALRVADHLSWLPATLARIVLGVVFLVSGWGKLHSLTDVTAFFTELHIPAPAFQAHLVAGTEFIAGLLLLFGLLTRLAAVPIVITMVVAIITAKIGDLHGLTDLVGFQELDYIVLAVVVAIAGPGPISIDRLVTWAWSRRDAARSMHRDPVAAAGRMA